MLTALGIHNFCGMLSLGVQQAGFDIKATLEEGSFGNDTHRANIPGNVYNDQKTWPLCDLAEDGIDLVYGQPACFTGDTLILTDRGYIPIADITVGTVVQSHTGKWKKVTETIKREAPDTLVIKPCAGFPSLSVTGEHPFYVKRKIKKKVHYKVHWAKNQLGQVFTRPEGYTGTRYVIGLDSPGWTMAKDLSPGDMLFLPKTTESPAELKTTALFNGESVANNTDYTSTDTAWLLGLYIAEGGCRGGSVYKRGTLCGKMQSRWIDLSLHAREIDYVLARVVRLGYASAVKQGKGLASRIYIHDTHLHDFCKQHFLTGSKRKIIPGWVFCMGVEWRESFLAGYLYGDGSNDGKRQRWCSVSISVTYGIAKLYADTRSCCAQFYARNPSNIIQGRKVNGSINYNASIRLAPAKRSKGSSVAHCDSAGTWVKIKHVSQNSSPALVYNLEVADDHSYTTISGAAHNCAGSSQLNAKRNVNYGSNAGIMDTNRVGQLLRPRAFMVESVAGLFKIGEPMVVEWERQWADIGYNTTRLVEQAAHCGVPQTRKRIFFIAAQACLDFAYGDLHTPTPRTVREAIGDLIEQPLYERLTDPQPYVSAPQNEYQERMRQGSPGVTWQDVPEMSDALASVVSYIPPGQRPEDVPEEIYEKTYYKVRKKSARADGKGKPSFMFRRLHLDKPSTTLAGGAYTIHPCYNRYLTVREEARLMGVPDRFVYQATLAKAYDQVGKAVSPIVGAWVASQIAACLADPHGRVHKRVVDLTKS